MMSWLNLKRKLWNLLKNKLPLKLHKLSTSIANNKKSKNISYKTNNKSLSIQPKKFKTKPIKPHTFIHHQNRNYKSQKPVFVDQLFVKPVFVVHTAPSLAGEVKKGGVCDHKMISADDMWESMVLGSPHIHEIDERAEEFIARIKAEMRHQEILARRL